MPVINGTPDNDILIGTAEDDAINGLAGDDTLDGLDGSDTLDGGTGADAMAGGADDDTYVVDNAGDQVTEALNAGIDTVNSSISYTLTDNVENLVLTGTSEIDATGNDGDNALTGNAGANVLDGGAGNDFLQGGFGPDTLSGGEGDDTLRDFSGVPGEINILDGGPGADDMAGGFGNDIYVVDDPGDVAIDIFGGTDTVRSSITFSMDVNDSIENLILTGTDAINATGTLFNNVLTGNSASNSLRGLAGDDTLDGLGGSDTLDGGTGADTMVGGVGWDLYYVDHTDDFVIEAAGVDIDWVYSSISYSLTDNVENLTLFGANSINGTGNELDNIILGNGGSNALNGGDGSDTLNGGSGSDAIAGGLGDDTYFVNSVGDVVTESASEGTDTVRSSIAFTLGDHTENLTLEGVQLVDGTGNEVDNVITGNSAGNQLSGLGGDDTLNGGSGNDTLDGGTGFDAMAGGADDDTYVVHDSGDTIVELADGGNDTVLASFTYALGEEVDNLTLIGSGDIGGTGNELDNVLTGTDWDFDGSGENTLVGGAGSDVLDGRSGFDALEGGTGDDTYVIDDFMGGSNSILLYSRDGDYIGSGLTYSIEAIPDVTIFDVDGDGLVDHLTLRFDNSRHWFEVDLSAEPGANLAPGSYSDAKRFPSPGHPGLEVTGDHRGSNMIFGDFAIVAAEFDYSGAAPVLISFSAIFEQHSESPAVPPLFGTVNYNYDAAGPIFTDAIVEHPDEGIDTVMSAITYALQDDLENLTLTGNEDSSAFGNASDNVITGNSGNNVLMGDAGNDSLSGGAGKDFLDGGTGTNSLQGGAGDDRYDIAGGALSDSVLEDLHQGTDTVNSTGTYVLPDNVEILELAGDVDFDGSGNELGNILRGNAGVNALSGNAGNDGLIGNAGNDLLNGGSGLDTLKGGSGDDTYVIEDGTSFAGGTTSLHMQSQPGDWVGAGQEYSFDTTTGTFQPDSLLDSNLDGLVDQLRISYSDLAGNNFSLAFSTANAGTNLAPGTYIGAERAAFASEGKPGLDVSGNGRGSNTVFGSFTILEAEFDYGGAGPVLTSFAARFEQHSESPSAAALFGIVTYNFAAADPVIPDLVIENPDEGTDSVLSSITYTLPENVENLSLSGSDNSNGTGNSLANTIRGNSGNNVLDGGAGSDILSGSSGDDTLNGDADNDILNGSSGDDVLNGNSGDDELRGSSGNDTLNGSAGNDDLYGSIGNDTLNGGSGDDTMAGGASSDNYMVAQLSDVVIEEFGEGSSDTVQSSVDVTLWDNVESLTLTGSANRFGTGNDLDNTIVGNSGNNLLNGKGGADTLLGGGGADTLIWSSSDGLLHGGSGNSDTLKVNGSGVQLNLKTLPGGTIVDVERIDLMGSGRNTLTLNATEVLDLSSTSNTLRVLGNSGDTVHRGGAWTQGADQLISGQSYETYTKGLATLLVDSDITSVV